MNSLISFLSLLFVFYNTNMQNKNNVLNGYFYHDENTVCDFGIFMGKIY